LDASAFVKLPLEEAEHEALRHQLAGFEGRVSSALLTVEAVRACSRYGTDEVRRARAGLQGLALVAVDDRILEQAASLEPPELRSLDAIHLATALSLGADLGVMFVYDERLRTAAIAAGLRAEAPV
jgi:predicted nucleic acid-binding protein